MSGAESGGRRQFAPDCIRIVTWLLLLASLVFITVDILDTLAVPGYYDTRQKVVAVLAAVFPNGISFLADLALMEIDEANITLEIVALAPLIPVILLADWVAHKLARKRTGPVAGLAYVMALAAAGYGLFALAIGMAFG